MGEYIERLDDGRPTLLRDGEIWTRVPKTRNSIMTLFGKVTYERHRYRRAGSPSLVPVDERLHEHHGLLCCTPPRPPSRFESDATGIGSTVRLSRFSIAAKGGVGHGRDLEVRMPDGSCCWIPSKWTNLGARAADARRKRTGNWR